LYAILADPEAVLLISNRKNQELIVRRKSAFTTELLLLSNEDFIE
jgi:hypothetical protein